MAVDLALRGNRLGGSQIPALYGADDFGRDQFSVYYSIKHERERKPPNPRQKMGKLAEPFILEVYRQETGKRVQYHDHTIIHPERAFMAATPDGFCCDEKRGVELKLVYWDQRKLWGETPAEIPMRVILQCWWYMAFFDMDAWDVCALVNLEPRIYTIERDREAERSMLDYCERWHAKYIIGDAIPPIGHTAEAARYLQEIYPDDNRPSLREADEQEAALLDEYVGVRIEQDRIAGRRAELETQIKCAIADCEGLTWSEGKFTWRKTRDAKKVRWEDMALGLLNQFVKDAEEQERLEDFYTTSIPGYRKIRLDHPAVGRRAKHEQREEVEA